MSKPVLRLGFTDSFTTLDTFFIDTLSQTFDIQRDDENPNFLIFCDENFGQNNVNFNNKNVAKIFFTGENRRAYNYHCHFAMTYDHDSNPKHYRLPLYVLDNRVNTKILGLPDIHHVSRTAKASDKKGFCSFVVKNGGCEERNRIFHLLSQYKKVDSGGPLFNNIGHTLSREGLNGFHMAKYDFLKERKFNICYENGSHPGYVTEKIFHALTYNTIPIYWGSPTVEMDFNTNAFISRHDFNSDEEMIEKIIELDQNDDLYNEMLSQPIMNPRNKVFDLDRFNKWFYNNVYSEVMK
jgi:hypothetical protein